MSEEMVIKFYGPIPWVGDDSIRTHPRGNESGIYLWTAETQKGFEIFYIGETSVSFRYRLAQHFNDQLTGKYHFYIAKALHEGRKETPWKGIVGMKGAKIETYHENFAVWNPLNIGFIQSVRFFIAPLPVHDPQKIHKRLLHRVEGGLIEYLWKQEGNFLDKTLHSRRLKESETAIRASVEGPKGLIGFPANIIV